MPGSNQGRHRRQAAFSLDGRLGQRVTAMPLRCARSMSAAAACVMWTALNAGVSSPRFHSRSMGRAPWSIRHWAISSPTACRSITIPASSSSANVTRRANVASLTGPGECGAKAVAYQGMPLYSSRKLKARVKYSAEVCAQGLGCLGDRHSDDRAHALFARDARGLVRKIIPIAETRDSRPQHFGDRHQRAVMQEVRTEQTLLESRRAGGAAQQRRAACVATLIMPGIKRCAGRSHSHGGRVARGRRGARQQVQNTPVANHQG